MSPRSKPTSRKPEEAERLCDVVLKEHAPIDILINNVGGRRINTPTEDLALEDWQRISI
jgi:NAD(P)-dependent dehydrogenase (short-subunit alcohol dehydrogenase family)